ncbi:hypothetical protein MXB_3460, partial [Myxobolus squamalis]
ISSNSSITTPKIVIKTDTTKKTASVYVIENSKNISSQVDVVTFKLSSLNISPTYFKSKYKLDHDKRTILQSANKHISYKSLDIFDESNHQLREREKIILSQAFTDYRIGSCRGNLVVSEKPVLSLRRSSLRRFGSHRRMSRLMKIAKIHGFTVSTPTDSTISDGEESTYSDDDEHYSE